MNGEPLFTSLRSKSSNEAAKYYNLQRRGLGDAFLEEVNRLLQLILAHPEIAPPITKTVRRKLIRRFPYAILYSLRPDEVRVLAIMNQKRRPFYWRGRR